MKTTLGRHTHSRRRQKPKDEARQARRARIRRAAPARATGYVTLSGAFFAAHRDEILACVRHCDTAGRGARPLRRILSVRRAGDACVVATSDVRLARRIGAALAAAFKGRTVYRYHAQDNLLRVTWSR